MRASLSQAAAGYTGVVGLKPSPGLVSRRGLVPLLPAQDTPVAVGRTLADAALLLAALACDPRLVPGPPSMD